MPPSEGTKKSVFVWKIDGRSMEVQFFQNTNTFLRIIDQTMSVSPLTGFTCLPSRGMADRTGFTE